RMTQYSTPAPMRMNRPHITITRSFLGGPSRVSLARGQRDHYRLITADKRGCPVDAQYRRAWDGTHGTGSRPPGRQEVSPRRAGRRLIRCVYYQWRSTQGGPGEFWQARENAHEWLTKLYVAARKELGLGDSSVYQDPPGGLPIPGGNGKTRHPP